MIWDKLLFRKYKDGRKIPLEMGIELTVDEMYTYHRELKDKFQYVYVDISHLKTLEQKQFFKTFANTYKLIIASPKYVNAYNTQDQSFARSIQYAQSMLNLSEEKLWAYVANIHRHYDIKKEVAYNTLENIYLKRVLPVYKRIGLNLVLEHNHKGPLVPDVFPLSFGLKLSKSHKGLGLSLDTLSAHLMGARFVQGSDPAAVSSLAKDYKIVKLSGIGKMGKRTSIRTCTQNTSGAYIEFVKMFKRSVIVLSTDQIQNTLGDWEYLYKYLGYKDKK